MEIKIKIKKLNYTTSLAWTQVNYLIVKVNLSYIFSYIKYLEIFCKMRKIVE